MDPARSCGRATCANGEIEQAHDAKRVCSSFAIRVWSTSRSVVYKRVTQRARFTGNRGSGKDRTVIHGLNFQTMGNLNEYCDGHRESRYFICASG